MSVVHSTFSIDRTYPAPPARGFAAFADQATKDAGSPRVKVGKWRSSFWTFASADVNLRTSVSKKVRKSATTFQDIVPDQRIIFAYTMTVGDQRISASLSTVELIPAGKGTKLVFTEQAAFLEGVDRADRREAGWGELFESLAKAIS